MSVSEAHYDGWTEGEDSVGASGAGDARLSSFAGRSLITNLENSVLETIGIWDDSSSEFDSTVEGRVPTSA